MPFIVDKTWDDARLKRDRLALLKTYMQARDVGALYLKDVSLRYVMNTKIPGGEVFIPATGEPITFVMERDLAWVSKQGDTRLRLQGNRQNEGEEAKQYQELGFGLAGLMEECGVSGMPLGVAGIETAAVLALGRLLQRRIQQAGIKPKGRHGTHALRFARAIRLLRASVPIKTIGDLLGHQSADSTGVYLRVAEDDLRAIGLEIPQ